MRTSLWLSFWAWVAALIMAYISVAMVLDTIAPILRLLR